MTPVAGSRVEEVFAEVLDLPPAARAAAAVRLAGGDQRVAREVLELLAQLDDDSFLDPDRFAREQSGLVFEGLLPVAARIDQYTVLGVLGAGGMGTVYLAEQARPRRQVALKVIAGPVARECTTARFEREAELLGRLSHPGIAQIFEAGVADYGLGPRPFIAMERIEGENLARYARSHTLGPRECAEMLAKIADAIEHAHLRGVIHRDLKPGNVLVGKDGAPKVVDFGVARAIDDERGGDATATGGLLGTLSYMAPEQIRDPQSVDSRADIYALGVMLYELLAGQPPHDCRTGALTDVIRRVCDEPAPRLGAVDRRLRGELESIVACALEKDRERRYRSAADFADDLRRWLNGEPIAARRDNLLDALGRTAARNRRVIMLGAGALAVAIVGGAWATAQAVRNAKLADSEREARDQAVLALEVAKREKARAAAESVRLRNRLYASNIGFAQAALAGGDIGRLQRLLADCPEDQRGWEWRYLSSFADRSERAIVPNREGLGYMAADPKRGRIAAARFGEPVKVYSFDGGEEIERFNVENGVFRLAFSPVNGELFAANMYGRVESISPDAPGITTLYETGTRGGYFSIRAGVNRGELVVADRTGVRLIGEGGAARWSHDGLMAAVLAVGRITGDVLCGGEHYGTTFLRGEDGTTLWSDEWPREEARGAAISNDETMAVIAALSGAVTMFDARTGEPRWRKQLAASRTMSIGITSDQRSVLVGATDGTIHVLDAASGEIRGLLRGHSGAVTTIESLGDDRFVTYARDGSIRWWSVGSLVGGEAATHVANAGLSGVTRLEDRFLAVSYAGELSVVDKDATRIVSNEPSATAWRAAVDPASRTVAVTRGDGTVLIRDLDGSRNARTVRVASARVSKASFSGDGALLACVDDSGMLSVIRAADGSIVSQRAGSPVQTVGVLWLPDDGSILTASEDGVLRAWAVSSGGVIEDGPPLIERRVSSDALWEIVASHDGRFLATSGGSGVVYLIDRHNGSVRELHGHSGPTFGLAFHPSEHRLASVGVDGRLRLWDTESGDELLQLGPGGPALTGVAFNESGNRLAAGGGDGMLRIWTIEK